MRTASSAVVLSIALGTVGMAAPGALAGHVSTLAIAGTAAALGRVGQTPLVSIVVTGSRPAKIAKAANALANIAVQSVSGGYVATKIKGLKRQVTVNTDSLKNIDRQIALLTAAARDKSLSATDRLILASELNGQTLQRSQVAGQLANYQQLLTLAQNVEQSKLFSPARATKTTARSRRNSILVGALIGLVLGILAALLWEPAVRVARRTSV